MGGVDLHDQLRLQRYSLQLSLVLKKYYKALFIGLVDMALVSAFIVHRANAQRQGQATPRRDTFLETLHAQLLEVTEKDFADSDVRVKMRVVPVHVEPALRMSNFGLTACTPDRHTF